MSAPPLRTAVTTSASGYEDGFGRRVLMIERKDGAAFERLYLRPQFSLYERALRDTCARLAAREIHQIVGPRSIERDPVTGELVAISPFVSGERLDDLLDGISERARHDEAAPSIDVALGFLLDVLPALSMLRAETGLSHGAIAPPRCVFTSGGQVVLTECGFAPILQRLDLNRERLWREWGVAAPPLAGAARFDETGDVSQAALMATMLILGRPPGAEDATDVLPEWLAEAIEIAQIRGSVSFAVNLQRFLQRALPLPGRRPYQTVDSALHDVRQLADSIGIELCRESLAAFVRHATGTKAPVDQEVPLALPLNPTPSPAEILTTATVPDIVFEPVVAPATPAPMEPLAPPVLDDRALEPRASRASVTLPDFEAFRLELDTPPHEQRPPAEKAPESEPSPAAAIPPRQEPEPVAVRPPEPTPEPAWSRRRRWRSKRAGQDALRSALVPRVSAAVSRPPAPVGEPLPSGPIAPVASPPSPPLPLVSQPAGASALRPVVVEPVVPQPAIPQPVFAPLGTPASERLWTAPPNVAPPPVGVPKSQPIAAAPPSAPLRLKSDPPAPVGRTPRPEPRELFVGYARRRPPASPGSRRVSWKFVAAAAAVIVTVIAAGRAYLPDTPAVNAAATRTAPMTVTAPPPVTTGTIVVQTQPTGARVLLDGSPAGETPLRIVDVAPGRHLLTFVTPTATIKRTVKVEANKTLTLDVPVFSGWVAIFSPIVLEVSEAGRTIGTTDQGRLLLPPGRHTLTLANRDFVYTADHAVEIQAGEVRSLNVQPTGTVNLNAVPWAEVWIDGKKAGDTPVANLQLPLGNREIVFRHPELGERKLMTKITAGAPVAVSVDFTR